MSVIGAGVLRGGSYNAGGGASNAGATGRDRSVTIAEAVSGQGDASCNRRVNGVFRPASRLIACLLLNPCLVVSSIVRAEYAARCDEARRVASLKVSAEFGIPLSLNGWSLRASSAVARWPRAERLYPWDWDEIHRRYRNEPDRFDLCMWVGDALCGVALTTLSGPAATINFLEGQPGDDCPLKGLRAAIAIEAAQRYAQLNGRAELRVQPISEELENLYRDIFGFELATPKGEQAYYWWRIP